MAQYMRERRARRRQDLIEYLGGACSVCGSTENLEIDHKDRSQKTFVLSGYNLDGPWDKILDEADKCQLLCQEHHLEKTLDERPKAEHGTITMYQEHGCRCTPCVHGYAERRKLFPSRRRKVAV